MQNGRQPSGRGPIGGRHALRASLRRSSAPQVAGILAVAILGLALGIGANVALFSVINSVFLRPLPYREPDRLVRLASTHEAQQLRRVGFSHTRYLEVEARQQVFSDLALSTFNAFTWTGRGDPEQLIGLQASAELLPTLGLQPALGRNFSAAEDRPGGDLVILIGHALWQQRFNGDPRDPRAGAHARRPAAHRHRGATCGGHRLPAEPGPDLGAASRRGVVSRARAAQQRRLLLPGHRPAPTGGVAAAGPRRHDGHRRRLSRGQPGQCRCAVADRTGAAARRCRGRSAAELSPAVRRGRLRAADRLREHRQPAAGAFRGPAPRDRRAVRPRRQRRRRRPPAGHREHGRRRARRRAGSGAGAVDLARPGRVRSRPDSPGSGDRNRSAGARLRPRDHARHRPGDRPAAGAAGGAGERPGGAEGREPRLHRRWAAAAGRPAGGRSVAVAGAAHRRRPARDELRAPPGGEARLPARGRVHRAAGRCPRSDTPATRWSPSTSGSTNAWRRRCRADRRPRSPTACRSRAGKRRRRWPSWVARSRR